MASSLGSSEEDLRRALWAMPTGLYVLSMRGEGRDHLMTISLAVQVAKEPRVLACAVEEGAHALGFLGPGAAAGLALLAPAARALARRFAKPPEVDEATMTAAGVPVVRDTETGLLVPRESLGMLRLRVASREHLGSHWLVLARVEGLLALAPPVEWGPLLAIQDTRMRYGG